MTAQLMTAISNRDGDALARMAAGSTEPQRLLDFEAERLVDSLFRQLKQISRRQRRPICAPTPKRRQRSASGLPLLPKTESAPVSSYPQECAMREPVNRRSGHRLASSSSGARTAALCSV